MIVMWVVVVELLGLAALPLTAALFPSFRDRGYGLTKVVGLLTITWANWLLGVGVGEANHPPLLWPLAALTCALGLWALRVRGEDVRAIMRGLRRTIVAEEALFLGAFAVWTAVRASHPAIYGTEKPMDLMYLTTTMEHGHFPPADLWLSGTSVNYYYLGYAALATVAVLAGVSAPMAFNLALALLFALTLSGAYTVGLSLTRSPLWAALAAAFVGLAGNLTGWAQMWANLMTATPNWGAFNWCASRVIGGCAHYTTINEFPFFSFVWGDLHPHVIALPFVLLCLGVALQALLAPDAGLRTFGSCGLAPLTLGLAALALGSLYAINSWDFPAYLLLAVLCLVANPFVRGASLIMSVRVAAPTAVLLVVLSVLLWLPFWRAYHSSAGGVGVRVASTDLGQYLVVNGVFLTPVLLVLAMGWRPHLRRWVVDPDPPPSRPATLGIAHTPDDDMPVLPTRPVIAILIALVGGALLVMHAPLSLLAAIVLVLVVARLLMRMDGADPRAAFGLLATALALGLTILCEYVYIKDIFDGSPDYRMNTVFKFYYDMWVVLALAAAWAIATLWKRAGMPGTHRLSRARIAIVGLLAAIVVTTGTYTALAIPNSGGAMGAVPTLDGSRYLESISPGDAAAIAWLRDHASHNAVVAEAVGGDYWGGQPDRPGQVSIFSGLPTLIEAAPSHEELWHQNDSHISNNQAAAAAIYGMDSAAARAAIVTNDVHYVYVGPQEAQVYGQGRVNAPNLTKFSHFMHIAYRAFGVTIYSFTTPR
jgi:YYY domain-containing protein